jgi:hypothetical protein
MKNIFTLTDALDLMVDPHYTAMVEAIDYASPVLGRDVHIRLNLGNPNGTFDSRAAAEALEFRNAVLEHSLNYEVEDLDNDRFFNRLHIFTFIGGKLVLKLRMVK